MVSPDTRALFENAAESIREYNQRCLHYNLVADANYQELRRSRSPFSPDYERFLIAALISFDMGRMIGSGMKQRYNVQEAGFAARLHATENAALHALCAGSVFIPSGRCPFYHRPFGTKCSEVRSAAEISDPQNMHFRSMNSLLVSSSSKMTSHHPTRHSTKPYGSTGDRVALTTMQDSFGVWVLSTVLTSLREVSA